MAAVRAGTGVPPGVVSRPSVMASSVVAEVGGGSHRAAVPRGLIPPGGGRLRVAWGVSIAAVPEKPVPTRRDVVRR